jgi:CheY-like chemotaxis protein
MPARILIVDDEHNIIATVAPLLQARGARWTPAPTTT